MPKRLPTISRKPPTTPPTEAGEDALENQADATREAGEENADATRTSADADGNSAN